MSLSTSGLSAVYPSTSIICALVSCCRPALLFPIHIYSTRICFEPLAFFALRLCISLDSTPALNVLSFSLLAFSVNVAPSIRTCLLYLLRKFLSRPLAGILVLFHLDAVETDLMSLLAVVLLYFTLFDSFPIHVCLELLAFLSCSALTVGGTSASHGFPLVNWLCNLCFCF
jgi:hypothetical protein